LARGVVRDECRDIAAEILVRDILKALEIPRRFDLVGADPLGILIDEPRRLHAYQ
jgi:hypothetical protein